MKRLIICKQTCRCFGDIALRCPYVTPEMPGAESFVCLRNRASRSSSTIGTSTSVRSTLSMLLRISPSSGEVTLWPAKA